MPLHMRTPKFAGFKNPYSARNTRLSTSANWAISTEGGEVTVADLVEKGAAQRTSGEGSW